MEHIRQRSQEHASSPLDVAEDGTGLRPVTQLSAVAVFPSCEKAEKLVPVSWCVNMCDLEKYLPELSGIGGLGIAAAPGKSLPLNMNQASLHRNIRPELVKNPDHRGIAIDGEASWAQPTLFKSLQEHRKLRLRALGDTVAPSNQPVSFGVHQSDKASRSAEECSVQDKMLILLQIQSRLRRRLFKVISDHSMKLSRAIATLARQLPNRIAFNKPTSEPFLLSPVLGRFVTPANRAPTRGTKPSLLPISVMAIPLENSQTLRTVFFCPQYLSSLNQSNDYGNILRLRQS